MRFLIINTVYSELVRWFYAQRPELEKQTCNTQMQAWADSLFGVADFYSNNLRKLGHEAYDIYANNEFVQKAWAREHDIRISKQALLARCARPVLEHARCISAKTLLRYLKPVLRPMLTTLNRPAWFYSILAAQIKHHKPDILLNQEMGGISSRFLKETKPYVRLLMGQIASPIPQGEDFGCYDLVISCAPHFVEYFRESGISAELSRLAFEPRVLPKIANCEKTVPLSFVGQLSRHHKARIHLLEYICQRFDIEVWGVVDALMKGSPIHQRYRGQCWGIEMYRALCRSKIALNHHIDVAESYAGNCRLYEATGVGTFLLTDWKVNLHEIFEPGEEVVTYRTPEECAELIKYYLEHDDEREAIARAGQQRTLKEHTYYQRMQELVEIVHKYL